MSVRLHAATDDLDVIMKCLTSSAAYFAMVFGAAFVFGRQGDVVGADSRRQGRRTRGNPFDARGDRCRGTFGQSPLSSRAGSIFTAHRRRHGTRAPPPGRTDSGSDVPGPDTDRCVLRSRSGVRDRILPESMRVRAHAVVSQPTRKWDAQGSSDIELMLWRSNAHQVVAGTRSWLDRGSLERSARKGQEDDETDLLGRRRRRRDAPAVIYRQ
jgi:hypothetical protein